MKTLLLVLAALNICLAENTESQRNESYYYPGLINEARDKNIKLTEKEESILEIGEVSDTRYIVGGVLGTVIGFGTGHAVQGTWSHKGYIFTAAEAASLAVFITSLNECIGKGDSLFDNCNRSGSIAFSYFALVGLRIWEIVDVWAGVPNYRDKQRDLKRYIEAKKAQEKKVSFHLAPVYNSKLEAPGLGLQMRF